MRQGEVAPTASWIGNPQGGVSAPAPVILPDPARRFSRTANRLEALAAGHSMQEWLLFLARLSRAQHDAAVLLAPIPLDGATIAKLSAAGMPPLAADGHRRDPAWRDGLKSIVGQFDRTVSLPDALRAVIDSLNSMGAAPLEGMADDFLSGWIAPDQAGRALFIAAALQTYFTHRAASLTGANIHLLPERGLCPCCGSTPVSGLVTISGTTPGARYLYCSLCSTAWNHVRAVCITCAKSGTLSLRGVEGASEAIKAETCDDCHTYSKMLTPSHDSGLDAYADDLASLGLDLMLSEAGWSRHAPNPLLLAHG